MIEPLIKVGISLTVGKLRTVTPKCLGMVIVMAMLPSGAAS